MCIPKKVRWKSNCWRRSGLIACWRLFWRLG